MRYLEKKKFFVTCHAKKQKCLQKSLNNLLPREFCESQSIFQIFCSLLTGVLRGILREFLRILRLKWQDVNWDQATARINITKTKKPREIGLSPLAIATLRSLPRSTDGRFFPCNVNGFNSYWRKVLKAAELQGVFTFHRLRHQGATDLAESDWSIAELSAQGGWKSLSSLKRYTHIQPKHLANKMKQKG